MEQFTHEERLKFISEMIYQAKRNVSKGGSFQLLFWGWIVALANFGHYTLEKIDFEMPYVVWLIIIPAIIVSVVHSFRMSKQSNVKGFLDEVYGLVWLAVFICMIITLVFMSSLNFNHNPIILLFAGIGVFLTGVLLKFKPVIYGAILLWIGAIISFTQPVTDQYLISGICILIGYLIPGYLLKKAERE